MTIKENTVNPQLFRDGPVNWHIHQFLNSSISLLLVLWSLSVSTSNLVKMKKRNFKKKSNLSIVFFICKLAFKFEIVEKTFETLAFIGSFDISVYIYIYYWKFLNIYILKISKLFPFTNSVVFKDIFWPDKEEYRWYIWFINFVSLCFSVQLCFILFLSVIWWVIFSN